MEYEVHTIDEVIGSLRDIIRQCIDNQNFHGLFACLYLNVTQAVKEGIQKGRFQDPARMEKLDVIFAKRYLDAYWQWGKEGAIVSRSWDLTLSSGNQKLAYIQHILLGINTHINLDLGIAAAETAPGANVDALKDDFDTINEILTEMIDDFQVRIGKVSPALFLIDVFGKDKDERFVGFALKSTRDRAWKLARQLALIQDESMRNQVIKDTDHTVKLIGDSIIRPGKLISWLLFLVRVFESDSLAATFKKIGYELGA